MQRFVMFIAIIALILTACAGGSSDEGDQVTATDERGDLLVIEQQNLELTVQPTANLLMLRSSITIPAAYANTAKFGYMLLHKDAYIEDIHLDGVRISPVELRVLKQKFFPESMSDSDWDRISEFASMYKIDLPRKSGAEPQVLSMEYSIRVSEEMSCFEIGSDEFFLDDIGFWRPGNLDNSYPVHLEVTHPANFFIELLDNRPPSEEVTPTMRRTDFDVSGLTEPLLLFGYRQ